MSIINHAMWMRPRFIKSVQYRGSAVQVTKTMPSKPLLIDRLSSLLHANMKTIRTWLRYCSESTLGIKLKVVLVTLEESLEDLEEREVVDMVVMMLKAIIDQKFSSVTRSADLCHDPKFSIMVDRLGGGIVGSTVQLGGLIWDPAEYIRIEANCPESGMRISTWSLRDYAKKQEPGSWTDLV